MRFEPHAGSEHRPGEPPLPRWVGRLRLRGRRWPPPMRPSHHRIELTHSTLAPWICRVGMPSHDSPPVLRRFYCALPLAVKGLSTILHPR